MLEKLFQKDYRDDLGYYSLFVRHLLYNAYVGLLAEIQWRKVELIKKQSAYFNQHFVNEHKKGCKIVNYTRSFFQVFYVPYLATFRMRRMIQGVLSAFLKFSKMLQIYIGSATNHYTVDSSFPHLKMENVCGNCNSKRILFYFWG